MEAHVQYPDRFAKITTDEKYLRQPSKQVDIQNPEEVSDIKIILTELQDILITKENWMTEENGVIGYGLAACQLKRLADTGKPAPRVGVVRIPNIGGWSLSLDMINPQILDLINPFKYKSEGCLSFPGQYTRTKRYRRIKLGFIDGITMQPRELSLYGFEAVVIQHEVDHHDGILFRDRHEKPTVKVGEKLRPNDPCICGSGKKVKKCDCGAYNLK